MCTVVYVESITYTNVDLYVSKQPILTYLKMTLTNIRSDVVNSADVKTSTSYVKTTVYDSVIGTLNELF